MKEAAGEVLGAYAKIWNFISDGGGVAKPQNFSLVLGKHLQQTDKNGKN